MALSGLWGCPWGAALQIRAYLALMALLEVTLRFKIIVTRGMLLNPPLPSLLETLVALWHRRNGRHQHHFELRRSCSWERGLFIFIFIFQNIKSNNQRRRKEALGRACFVFVRVLSQSHKPKHHCASSAACQPLPRSQPSRGIGHTHPRCPSLLFVEAAKA